MVKKIFLIATLATIVLSVIALPVVAQAQTAPNIWPAGYWGPILSCTGDYTGTTNATPCVNLCNLVQTIINILYFGISIAIFIVAPILFIVGAIMIMLAGASPELLSRGKKTLTGTFIGLILVLSSYLIVSTIVTVLHISNVGGFSSNSCSPSSS